MPFTLISSYSYAVNTECGVGYNSYQNNYGDNHSFQPNASAFAALKADGSITVWGDAELGGSGAPIGSGYISITPAAYSFAALKADGSITVWGSDDKDEIYDAPTDAGYISIASIEHGYAALKADGSITAWGDTSSYAPTDAGYISIASTEGGYAALKADGSIVSWGVPLYGQPTEPGYINIVSNGFDFAAMKDDGSIKVWGQITFDGNDGPTDHGYVSITSNALAFAAMKDDGSITTWGSSDFGGSGAPTDRGYVSIASTFAAFAALKADGSITAWGSSDSGGSGEPTDTGYVSIVSNESAFAALKEDGSITAWGDEFYGGSGAPSDSDYISIAASETDFAALKADGRIKAWGFDANFATLGLTDLAAPTDSGYVSIVSNRYAFAALKADGSITAWGTNTTGGTGEPTDSGYISINGVGPNTPKDCSYTRLRPNSNVASDQNHNLAAGASVCVKATGITPGDSAIINITPVHMQGPGHGALRSPDATPNNERPVGKVYSNVNFGLNTVDPNVAAAEVGPKGTVCYDNSVHHAGNVVMDVLLGIKAEAAYLPSADGPVRIEDTRTTPGALNLAAGASVCVNATGIAPGDFAIINITPVHMQGPGHGALRSSDATPNNERPVGQVYSNVNFALNTVDPNVAAAKVGPNGTVCYDNSVHHAGNIVMDVLLGVKAEAAYLPSADGPVRIEDTRTTPGALNLAAGASVCVNATGIAPGDFAIINITPVHMQGPGYGALRSSDATPNNERPVGQVYSNVNFALNTVDPNVAAAEVGPNGTVCYDNSVHHAGNVVMDVLLGIKAEAAYLPSADGPIRIEDTRKILNTEPVVEDNVNPVSDNCNRSNFTPEIFDAIQPNMSLDQVTQLIGCKHNPSATNFNIPGIVSYAWLYFETQTFFSVTFDRASGTVSDRYPFKFWQR